MRWLRSKKWDGAAGTFWGARWPLSRVRWPRPGASHTPSVWPAAWTPSRSPQGSGMRTRRQVLTTPLSAFASTLAILKLRAAPVFVDTDERGLIDLDACRPVLRRGRTSGFCCRCISTARSRHAAARGVARRVRSPHRGGLRAIHRGQPSGHPDRRRRADGRNQFLSTKNLAPWGRRCDSHRRPRVGAYGARPARLRARPNRPHELVGYNSRLDELQAACCGACFFRAWRHGGRNGGASRSATGMRFATPGCG